MATLKTENLRNHIQNFDFKSLFIEELGWSRVSGESSLTITAHQTEWVITCIAELSGVVVFLVDGLPDRDGRLAIYKELSNIAHENLVIFVDQVTAPTQSLWLWVKREGKKVFPREHLYVQGQPGDLFMSKISAIIVDINEFDESGQFPLAQLVERMQAALDVERVTKKFFKDYDAQRLDFIELIDGILDVADRRWYASVLMNRLMFIWFLQRKHFLGHGDRDYLVTKLAESQQRGKDRFYAEFLQALFFEGFAKTPDQRSAAAQALIGEIRFLNGGLFLPHRLEEQYQHAIFIPDVAFENLFQLFARYSWNLNDTVGAQDDEINPDVLGYIFEKYINQKTFGAYYTRPEITEYLCEQTIHRLIVARINTINADYLPHLPGRVFSRYTDILMKLDANLCDQLLNKVLPNLKLLDPACGSGAFLVAALKTLINIYSAVIGRIPFLKNKQLSAQVAEWERQHKSIMYFIKRRIITDNLFGVDIMAEATEIAKLRLFLALVASANTVDELEPLPNIDFNILAGNSLIGLLRVDAEQFDANQKEGEQFELFRKKTYAEVVNEKNRLVDTYRHTSSYIGDFDLSDLKQAIEKQKKEAQTTLNELLLADWSKAGIKFEEALSEKATKKKPSEKGAKKDKKSANSKKRILQLADIEALQPFHWGFEFDDVLNQRGGFDAIITNPPWEIFKPNAKEFFLEHSDAVSKNKMTIKEFEKEQAQLLKDASLRSAWLAYLSGFAHVSSWFRVAPQFKHQSAIVNGKKTGSDVNLYKLFVEQCVNLLREGGECGIVIPSGIYTDLGAKGLRDLLFNENTVTGLFCFENRNEIFEGVHRSFKFVVLTFAKGGSTEKFPAAFMRHDVADLRGFPSEIGLPLSVDLIRRLSPDSHSVMEFKTALDIQIAEKLLKFPLLGESIEGTWNLRLTNEFHMTNDSYLFQTKPGRGRLPLYEGKMIWQFQADYCEPRYWVDEKSGRDAILGRQEDYGQIMDYQNYRLGFRAVASNTNERSLIVSLLPSKVFSGNSIITSVEENNLSVLIFLAGAMNSFVIDNAIRQKVSQNLNMFFIYQIPIPRLTDKDAGFNPIVSRAARLICTTPEFDDLAQAVGLTQHGVLEAEERATLRAELDGLIAHLYGLTENEFAHVLTTFPLVDASIKDAALQAWRDVEQGLIV
ncbi:hypothetical protein SAMN05421644_11325 [Allochromatium warmingii]|uniref:site-specific DNA-methyltransferase (adenine-specific) n=1 Tax=Allochromatium warmingii TaxID=61595 RepID=A0A1H3EK02_ALLWA|nr:hypothetical protein SAMN05421644_11325 [Allochromatium warmingii]